MRCSPSLPLSLPTSLPHSFLDPFYGSISPPSYYLIPISSFQNSHCRGFYSPVIYARNASQHNDYFTFVHRREEILRPLLGFTLVYRRKIVAPPPLTTYYRHRLGFKTLSTLCELQCTPRYTRMVINLVLWKVRG